MYVYACVRHVDKSISTVISIVGIKQTEIRPDSRLFASVNRYTPNCSRMISN